MHLAGIEPTTVEFETQCSNPIELQMLTLLKINCHKRDLNSESIDYKSMALPIKLLWLISTKKYC